MHFSKTLLLLAIAPLSIAIDCTSSNAISFPTDDSSSGGSSGDSSSGGDSSGGSSGDSSGGSDGTCDSCGNDAACVQACLDIQSQGECNSVGGSACDYDNGDLIDGDSGDSDDDSSDLIKRYNSFKIRSTLRARATLSCTDSQTCYILEEDDALICLDETTGDFTDEYGGSGNAVTGEYTEPDGQETTVASGSSKTAILDDLESSTAPTTRRASSTPTPAVQSSSDGPSPSTLGSKTGANVASSAASSPTTSGNTSTSTPNSGIRQLCAGSFAMGVLGLGVGFVL